MTTLLGTLLDGHSDLVTVLLAIIILVAIIVVAKILMVILSRI
jgi:hypothetical protein